ncbi:MAG: holin [Armatimonadota bacterium]|nr:MAG: holin [Armatimonadota bacterium]
MQSWTWKSIAASVIAMFTAALGGWDALAQAMIACIALDVVAGLIRAGAECKLNSSVMRKGLYRKGAYFVAVLLAVLLDRSLFHAAPACRTLVISYIIVNESLSILEHLAALGVPIPEQVKDMLLKIREKQ